MGTADRHDSIKDDVRRHKRATSSSVAPEKTTLPQLPLDNNAPPMARLSMRRHSALETTIRDPSDVPPPRTPRGLAVRLPSPRQRSSGMYSSPSTPHGKLDRVGEEGTAFNLTTFNNSFNQSFNSINGLNSNANNSSSGKLSKPGSPRTPRKDIIDEDTINEFLTKQTNEVLQTSTKDVRPLLY